MRKGRMDRLGAGDIEMQRLRGADGLGKFLGGVKIDIGNPDEGPGVDEFFCRCFSNATGTARNEGMATVKAKGLR